MLAIKYPDYMFWIALTLFVDPGGFIQFYVERSSIGGIKVTDITFLLLLTPLISQKVKISTFFKQKDNRWFFFFLLFYALFYHILVFGFIAQGGDTSEFISFLQYQRLTTWGFFAIIPSYIFFSRNHKLFFKFAVITSALVMIAYIITLTTGMELIPIWEFERSRGSSIMRISVLSYGYADWFLLIFFAAFFFKIKLPYRNVIAFIGIMVFFSIILTLTRRTILSSFFSIFLIYYIHQKMIGKTVFSIKIIMRAIMILSVLVIVIFIIKPEYISYTIQNFQDTFTLVSTGKDVTGEKDGRFEEDIPKHLARFESSPFVGYGWDKLWYSNNTEEGGLSANDVPLTAALGMFGILGLLLFIPYYLKIFKLLFDFYKYLKYIYLSNAIVKNNITFAVGMFLLILFITKFSLNFMSYFDELIKGTSRIYNMIFIGFLLSIRDRYKYLYSKENKLL